MAYSVNWTTDKVISVPTSDLVLVSGTEYDLNMSDFLIEIRRLESEFTEGLSEPQILDHTNSKVIAGITYFPFDEIINGYTVQFTGVATRVNLKGTNNNIVDVLVANGVTVVPSNSAGGQIVSTGSGLDAGQDTKLSRIHALLDEIENGMDHQDVMRIMLAAMAGKVSGADTNTISFRDNADTKDRIVATTDGNGNRTAVTLDET